MRKPSRKFLLALTLCAVLVYLAINWAYTELMSAVLFALGVLVACVWIVSEAKVDRAAAPINLPPESGRPPDKAEE